MRYTILTEADINGFIASAYHLAPRNETSEEGEASMKPFKFLFCPFVFYWGLPVKEFSQGP